jgi:hypothetical protein
MKRFVLSMLFLSALVCSVAVFAESAATEYVVQSVSGTVEIEASAGKWESLAVGTKLAPAAVVNTGVNSTLVVKLGDKVITIKAMQKGTIEKLSSVVTSSKTGIKLGSKASTTDVTADAGQSRTNVSTASTRASDATKDLEWEESAKK